MHTYVAAQAAMSAHCYDPWTPNMQTRSAPDVFGEYWWPGADCYLTNFVGAKFFVNYNNFKDYALNKWKIDQRDLKPQTHYGWNGSYFWHDYFGSTNLYFSADRYEIFAMAAPSWSYALGAQPGVGGKITGEIDLYVTFAYEEQHKYHSAEFRSTIQDRWSFWKQLLKTFGLQQ